MHSIFLGGGGYVETMLNLQNILHFAKFYKKSERVGYILLFFLDHLTWNDSLLEMKLQLMFFYI